MNKQIFQKEKVINTKRNLSVVLIAALIVSLAGNAMATLVTLIEFEPISEISVDVEGLDLFMNVSEGVPGQAILEFHNESRIQSSISSICFEGNGLAGIVDIQSGEGTNFETDEKPFGLPGGQTLDPVFKTYFSIHGTPPPSQNGINPGEQITVTIQLDPELTYSDILSSLSEGSLRVGMHVIALSDGSSYSAINQPVPEPATLGMLGLGGLLLIRRRRA